jgi:hypothetical protein
MQANLEETLFMPRIKPLPKAIIIALLVSGSIYGFFQWKAAHPTAETPAVAESPVAQPVTVAPTAPARQAEPDAVVVQEQPQEASGLAGVLKAGRK